MLSYKEILALLDKAVKKTVERVVSASDKQAKSVKKHLLTLPFWWITQMKRPEF